MDASAGVCVVVVAPLVKQLTEMLNLFAINSQKYGVFYHIIKKIVYNTNNKKCTLRGGD